MNDYSSVDRGIPIRDLSRADWWESPAYAAVRFQFFTSSHHCLSKGQNLSAARAALSISSYPVTVAFIDVDGEIEIPEIRAICIYEKCSRSMKMHAAKMKIEPGSYVLISSPVERYENGTKEDSCKEAMETVRGALCSMFGGSIAHMLAGEIVIDQNNKDSISSISNIIETMPHPLDYDFIEPLNIDALAEYVENEKDPLWIRRMQTCFLLLGRSRREQDAVFRFFDMWTALEVYVGGPKKLAGLIDKAHDRKNWRMSMKMLKSKRDNMVHKGERYNLTLIEERIISATIYWQIFKRARIDDVKLNESVGN